jgi:hypothetical protein
MVYLNGASTNAELSERRSKIDRVNSPLVEVNIGLLADNVGVTTTNTLDLGQGEHDLALSLNVGVKETENVLCEVRSKEVRQRMHEPGTAGGPRGRQAT